MENPLDLLLGALEEGDLEKARRLARSLKDSIAASTQIAAEVLHELRQPLLGVKAYTQLLDEERPGSSSISMILAQVQRIEQIVSDFTRLASNRPAPKEQIDLSRHVRQAHDQFLRSPESARISLEADLPPSLLITGNGRLIEQLVLNLLNNARDAMSGRGRIKLVLTHEAGSPTLLVADWGPGIPANLRDRIFLPYVTGKARGTGLGLAVCQRVAREHDALIDLASPSSIAVLPPPATVFRVCFGHAPPAPTARPRLLVVDDESVIRSVFQDLMGKECEVVEASTAEEGLDRLREGRFDLLITDKNLPGLSGLDFAQEARKLDPASRVILMTGYPSVVTAQQAIELGILDYLLKPFDEIREVRAKIRLLLGLPPPAPPAARPAPARRVDLYEDNPASARLLTEALALLGLETRVLDKPAAGPGGPPAGVVVSWDFAPAHGQRAVELGREMSQGAPFVVLAEHLSLETTLECLRGGAAACLPKHSGDAKTLSQMLSRALHLTP